MNRIVTIEKKAVSPTGFKLANLSRTLFPNQIEDQIPLLPQDFEDVKGLLAERKGFAQKLCNLYTLLK